MGHKVHPKIHRTQVIYTWDSHWFADKQYAAYAEHEMKIREYLEKKFKDALIDAISIERSPKNMTITLLAAKPGFIIGRGGKGLDDARKYIETRILKMSLKVKLNVQEVHNPATAARVVGLTIANDLERRIPFRRVMKQSIERVMKAGAQGVKINLAGRLNGVEIARTEKLSAGKVPLITLRSDIDYAFVEAHTIYGKIGIKVWIYHGQVFGRKDRFAAKSADQQQGGRQGAPRADRRRRTKQSV